MTDHTDAVARLIRAGLDEATAATVAAELVPAAPVDQDAPAHRPVVAAAGRRTYPPNNMKAEPAHMNTTHRIRTSAELAALTPEEIVALDDARLIDSLSIAAERNARNEASARQARQIGAQLRSGALSEDDAHAALARLHDGPGAA